MTSPFPARSPRAPRAIAESRSTHGLVATRILLLLLAISTVLAGCHRGPLARFVRGETPHERYAESLRGAGLEQTALGRAWLAAADRALTTPVLISPPFREVGHFPAEQPHAVAYQIPVQRGQRLEVSLDIAGAEPPLVFVDLFAPAGESDTLPRWLASADSAGSTLAFEPRTDGTVLLRVQPELLAGGRYVLEIRSAPSLAFPVEGRDTRAVGSRFGVPRDGGRRVHHGIDIFAPRGTPVLAAADGFVTNAGTSNLGGLVIWVRDGARGQSHYYAHLDSQHVSAGARVRRGDTLGFVGNTGNARGTAPHLHFGIYQRGDGPVDPWPFVYETRASPPRVTADTSRLGAWVLAPRGSAVVRVTPAAAGEQRAALTGETPARVTGAAAGWYRVLLPGGETGWVAPSSVAVGPSPDSLAVMAVQGGS